MHLARAESQVPKVCHFGLSCTI